MNGYLDTLKEKSVLVVGLGRSGRASIEALAGKVKRLALQDSKEERDISDEDMKFLKDKGVECHFAHVPEDIIDFDMLVLSPGVPPAVAFVQEAKNAGAEIIGVNNRDLSTFHVDIGNSLRLRDCIPDGVVCVSESGISGSEDVRMLADAGFDAVLVGEAFMRSPDRRALMEAMRS